MNTGELIKKIQIAIDEPAIMESDMLVELNEVLLQVAAKIRLPSLIADGTVDILLAASSGDLPADYHHDLFKAYSNTNSARLTIRSNTKVIDLLHSETDTGDIEDVAVEGAELIVGPTTSAAEEIAIKYYKKPTVLVNNSDTPDCIPSHLHESTLADSVIMVLLPETGHDAKTIKDKVLWYGDKHNNGLIRLERFYPNAPKSKPVLRRKIRTF